MNILETTSQQFNRASELVTERHSRWPPPGSAALAKETEQISTLALRWSESTEWREWARIFEAWDVPMELAASIFSAGVEVGYELRVAQEDSNSN